jgi:hypothetical protein
VKTPALLLALILLPIAAVRGQDGDAVRVTKRLLPDGSSMTIVLNPDKRTRKETIEQADGKAVKITLYILNEQNVATAVSHFDGKGVIRYKEVYKFDFAGRISESKLFGPDDKPIGKRVYIYDASNNARIEDYDVKGNLITGKPAATASGAAPEVRKAVPVQR